MGCVWPTHRGQASAPAPAAASPRTLNINVGVLGHVDSGKTSLVRALSTELSTAALDKHPQSQERGITLDLGFSGFFVDAPPHVVERGYDRVHFTLVDWCVWRVLNGTRVCMCAEAGVGWGVGVLEWVVRGRRWSRHTGRCWLQCATRPEPGRESRVFFEQLGLGRPWSCQDRVHRVCAYVRVCLYVCARVCPPSAAPAMLDSSGPSLAALRSSTWCVHTVCLCGYRVLLRGLVLSPGRR